MLKRMFWSVLCAWFAQSAHASDKAEYYFSMASGASFTEDAAYTDTTPGNPSTGEFGVDNVGLFSLAVGTYVGDHFRIELEASQRNPGVETATVNGASITASGELETTGMLVNAYYDILPDEWVNPYVSAGIGAAYHDTNLTTATGNFRGDDTVFAYQVGVGANVALLEDFLVFVDYRYFASEDAQLGTTEVEYSTHEIRTGINYAF